MTYERPLNVEHFNKVIDHVETDLRRLWMPTFGALKGSQIAQGAEVPDFADCGTACCFAGWALLLTIPRDEWVLMFNEVGGFKGSTDIGFVDERAAKILGLTLAEGFDLFETTGMIPREVQWAEVKKRLRGIIRIRVEMGEESARGIRV